MEKVINLNLMKHPINWIIVPAVVVFTLQLFAWLYASTQNANPATN